METAAIVKAEQIVKNSSFDKETKQQHQDRINKARESFEVRLAKKVETNLNREARRSEMEKNLEAKKSAVVQLSAQIKDLRSQKKGLQMEIRAARKAARDAS